MSQFKKIVFLLTALAMILSIRYTYNKGLYDGEWNYKHSHRMYKALESAYKFGYEDCKSGRCNDWDGDKCEEDHLIKTLENRRILKCKS